MWWQLLPVLEAGLHEPANDIMSYLLASEAVCPGANRTAPPALEIRKSSSGSASTRMG